MTLCRYANLFGKPKEGVHKYRLFGIAIVDLGLTLLIALILCFIFSRKVCKERFNVFLFISISLVLFLLGIIIHRLFCVNTAINVKLFGYIHK